MSRRNYSILISFCFINLFILPCASQTSLVEGQKLTQRYNNLGQNYPPEIGYIQISKCIYERGEDLWFKAYLLNSHIFTPSSLSKTLYLQVVNDKTDRVVWQEKYEIQNGFSNGHVYLQDTLSEGVYRLEAYTQNSFFDDSSEFKAVRKIMVKKDLNQFVSTVSDVNKISGNSDKQGQSDPHARVENKIQNENKKENFLQFNLSPEGGYLVEGVKNKLAFKAINTQGYPEEVTGTLFENDTVLLEFNSSHAGMGCMAFTPLPGKKYSIHLSNPLIDSIFKLPDILTQGISMSLTGQDTSYLEFTIFQSPGLSKETVYLRGQQRGVVYCMAEGELNRVLRIKMPLKEFPGQGIAEFTLLNDKLLPVAERLVYINTGKQLNIETQLNKERYETRQKVILKIRVTDEKRQPIETNLGISVYDKLYLDKTDPENILSHCFLSSQLQGNIYDPAYYFDEKNADRMEALDLLMLTQGWRRYVWQEENLKTYGKVQKPSFFDGTEGHVNATKKQKRSPVREQFVMASNPGKDQATDYIVTDSTGSFMVTPEHFKTWQGGYIYLKPLANPEFEPRISITDPFQIINRIRTNKEITYPFHGIADTTKEMVTDPLVVAPFNEIMLREVTVTGKAIKPFRDKYIGRLDSIAKLKLNTDYVGVPCGTLNCPFHKKDKTIKPVEGKVYNVLLGKNGEILGSDYPYDYYFGEMNIVYHNPNLNLTEEELLKMNNLTGVKAYYVHREFYQPDYDKESNDYFIADSRNTLLWAPSVITDKNGEATLKFFCSDVNTGFVGKIEGVSDKGLLGIKDFEFAVRRIK